MFARRTLGILAALVGAYLLFLLAAYLGPSWLAEPARFAVLVPYLSLHAFHKLGVPGLLEHNGLCGWGWCSPTAFGWAFLAAFWIGVMWLVAWGLARLTARLRRRYRALSSSAGTPS